MFSGSLTDPASGGPQPATTSSPMPSVKLGAKQAALTNQVDIGMSVPL
jgi:hypothetical protein